MFKDTFVLSIIENMSNAFSYCRLIHDDDGMPADYEFMIVNQAMCELFACSKIELEGKTIRFLFPENEKENFDWFGIYHDAAVNSTRQEAVYYTAQLKRWIKIKAFTIEQGYFAFILDDMTLIKAKEELLLEQNRILEKTNRKLNTLQKRLKIKSEWLEQKNIDLSAANRNLNKKNQELAQIYEELYSTEEELRKQHEVLIERNEELAATEEELRHQYVKLDQSMCELARREEIYRLITETSNDGFIIKDVKNDYIRIPDKYQELLGYSPDELREIGGLDFTPIIHPDDRNKAQSAMESFFESKCSRHQDVHRLLTKHGEYKWFLLRGQSVYDEDGNPSLYVFSHTDINDIKKQQEQIEYLAYYDALTDLPERTLFMDRLKMAISLAERNQKMVAVIFMDIDNFKDVNDTLGHSFGDKLLASIAKRLQKNVRKHETIARIGGDEFSIILQEICEESEVANFCERLTCDLMQPFELENQVIHTTVSIGIAMYPYDGIDGKELLKQADTAMYMAKNNGKNRSQFFEENMRKNMLRRLEIERNLRKAIQEKRLNIHYQPFFNLLNGSLVSFEALLRWNDEEMGMVLPMEFVPIAESSGMILAMGEWVLREACRQSAGWQKKYRQNVVISVNISPIQLRQPNFVDIVKSALEESGLAPELLELEITEGILIQSFDMTVRVLNELRSIGVKISLDDFGTGYSSINYLTHLPLNTLKIDKSFIQGIGMAPFQNEIIDSIVALVHKLDIEVVAEGVETESQLEYMKSCNCDMAQGFLLGRPVIADEAEGFFRKERLP